MLLLLLLAIAKYHLSSFLSQQQQSFHFDPSNLFQLSPFFFAT